MAYNTTQLRSICEFYAGLSESADYGKIDEVIEASWDKVFDFDFPIFDEDYRNVLCKKIIKHFYMREIGCETVSLWKLYLCNKMNAIMPFYNQLYKFAEYEFNPILDTDMRREYKRNVVGNTNTESKDSNVNKYSDTPQGGLQDVIAGEYLTNATVVDNDGVTKGQSDSFEEYAERYYGMEGGVNFVRRMREWRDSFVNIDEKVMRELETLFFGLFN